MPKQRPPFDIERYIALKAQGLSQRHIAREMGMPDATLRNNLKVYQGSTSGGHTRSTEVDKDPPTTRGGDRSTLVDRDPPTSTRDVSQVSPRPPRDTLPMSTDVDQGPPMHTPPRDTQVSPGGLSDEMAHDLYELIAWWRQRAAGQGQQKALVRHTFHVEERWL